VIAVRRRKEEHSTPVVAVHVEPPFKIRVNGDLRGTPRVRVISADGKMLGEMPLAAALRAALQAGLDLVEVNPKASPPVCKILDFGKYKYPEKPLGPAGGGSGPGDADA
jgi:hypothetical protein